MLKITILKEKKGSQRNEPIQDRTNYLDVLLSNVKI